MKKELKRIYKLIFQPYMRILPGNIAFSLMMALIPILSLIFLALNIFNFSYPTFSDKLANFIPSAVIDIIMEFLSSNRFNSAILLIIGIWAASSGMNALIIASNVVYNHEVNNWFKRRAKALTLTFLVILMIVINLGVLVFGSTVLGFIIRLFSLSGKLLIIFDYAKWPIAVILIYTIVKTIYIAAPDAKVENNTVVKGSIFTTSIWMISSAAYSFYVTNIANYGIKYGSLANIIILLVWLYILSYVLVLGMAINVNEYNKESK